MVVIALVGRPNVGKSALFNRLLQKRRSIVHEREGVTRDRIYAEGNYQGCPFTLIDTGGLFGSADDPLRSSISKQAERALSEADAILFVVDNKVGPTKEDDAIAKKLHRLGKKTYLAINKVDHIDDESLTFPFLRLGFPDSMPISALFDYKIEMLLEKILKEADSSKNFPCHSAPLPKIAIVGRPNVGKSTLINTLLQEERMITSPLPGTTRDAVDIPVRINDKEYLLIDTAGIRRKKTDQEPLDYFARIRTEQAIERSDIVILMIDAKEGFTSQERQLAHQIEKANKACMIVMNKWDLIEGFRMEHCRTALHAAYPAFAHVPLLFISAKKQKNLSKLGQSIENLKSNLERKVSTSELNRFLEEAIQAYPPPANHGKRLKIYYATQIKEAPPRFLLFVNKDELMSDRYKKYLINKLRETFSFQGVPILLEIRAKEERSFTSNSEA